jgi:hypothetical protein
MVEVYCCPTATNPPSLVPKALIFLWYLQEKRRADERTRTSDLTSLRVIIRMFLDVACCCTTLVSKVVSISHAYLRVAGPSSYADLRPHNNGITLHE